MRPASKRTATASISSSPNACSSSASAPSVRHSLYCLPSSVASISPRCRLTIYALLADPFAGTSSLRRTPESSARSAKNNLDPGFRRGDGIVGLSRGETQRAGGLQAELETHLTVMLPAIFERGDLERALDRAEIRHDHLPIAHGARKEILAQRLIRRGVLEDAAAAEPRRLDAGAFQKLTPASGGFLVGDIDAARVERERARPQTRHRGEAARSVAIHFEQEILTLLRRHVWSSHPENQKSDKQKGRLGSRP